jgi:EF hand
MKKITIALSLAALGLGGGAALAAQSLAPGRDQTVARSDALARAGQMFARLDVNADGKLDPADREARRAAAFTRLDANKDGQISRDEFTAMRPPMGGPGMMRGHGMGGHRMGGQGMSGEGMGQRGDGQGMRGQGRGGMMLMRMADSNRDGAVSKDEFAAAAASRFDRADSNRDGQLTPAERQAARQAMRERMRSMMQQAQPGTAAPTAPQ